MRRVLLFLGVLIVAAPGAAGQVGPTGESPPAGESGQAGEGGPLPGGFRIHFDARLLEAQGAFKIARHGIVPDRANPRRLFVFWLLECQADSFNAADVRKAWGVAASDTYNRGPRILLKDDEKVLIEDVSLRLEGFHPRLRKGDGVRVILEAPQQLLEIIRFATISD